MIRLHLLGGVDLVSTAGTRLQSVLAQPKRTAVLAYLACAHRSSAPTRAELVELFWPDLEPESGRAALRKALHFLRAGLGADVVNAGPGDTLSVARERLWCDATAFLHAVANRDLPTALTLYRGDLLAGLDVVDAPTFSHWLDGERARLRTLAREAAMEAARAAARSGSGAEAWHFAEQACAIDVAAEPALSLLLEIGRTTGERERAIAAFDACAARLQAEYDLTPMPALIEERNALRREIERPVAGLAKDIRVPVAASKQSAEPFDRPDPFDSSSPSDRTATSDSDSSTAAYAPPPRRRVRRGLVAAAIVLFCLVGLLRLAAGEIGSGDDVRLLAVGHIRDLTAGDSAAAAVVPDLLATNLSRAPGVSVVSGARMQELLGGTADDGAAIVAAARRADARQLIEGALYRLPGGHLRLDLRRVDVANGTVYHSASVEGADVFSVVDAATAALLNELIGSAPDLRVADVTTHSFVALRFYQEGMRQQFKGRVDWARPLFEAALREDPEFVMAQFRLATLRHNDSQLLSDAVARADRLPENERLLITGVWLLSQDDPRQLAVAESLATRHVADPNGHLLLGRGLNRSGDFNAAVPHLRHVIAMDRAVPQPDSSYCRACDASISLIWSYLSADSVAAALRAAQAYVELQPQSETAWDMYINALELAGRYDDALAAIDAHRERSGGDIHYASARRSLIAMRRGDFQVADSLARTPLARPDPAVASSLMWNGVISLRNQGRLREAERLAADYARLHRPTDTPSLADLPSAIVFFEQGRYRDAIAIFESIATRPEPPELPSRAARRRVWNLTHAATAYAALGDRPRLHALADSIEAFGRHSLYGRDRHLHHHVRGLLARLDGDTDGAIAHFQQAVFSHTHGYTRTTYELAGALIDAGRPAEAIPMLESAIRGGVTASQLYLTLTALRDRAAVACERAGRPADAARHRAWVTNALSRADRPRTDR